MKQLTNIWGDFKEFLGAFITQSPAVQAAIQGTSKFVGELTNYLSSGNFDPSTTFGKLATFFQEISSAVEPSVTAVGNWVSEVSASLQQIPPQTAALSPLLFMIREIGSPTVAEDMKLVWQGIVESFSAIGEQLKPIWDGIVSVFSSGWELLKALWQRYGDEITLVATVLWENIKLVFSTAWNIISAAFQAALTIISGIFKTFAALLKGDWEGAWTAIKDTGIKLWGILGNFLKAEFGAFGTYFRGVWDAIKDYWSGLWEAVKAKVVSVFGGAVEWVSSKLNEIKGKFQWLYDVVVGHSIWPDMWSLMFQVAQSEAEKITGMVSTMSTGITSSFTSAMQGLSSEANSRIAALDKQIAELENKLNPAKKLSQKEKNKQAIQDEINLLQQQKQAEESLLSSQTSFLQGVYPKTSVQSLSELKLLDPNQLALAQQVADAFQQNYDIALTPQELYRMVVEGGNQAAAAISTGGDAVYSALASVAAQLGNINIPDIGSMVQAQLSGLPNAGMAMNDAFQYAPGQFIVDANGQLSTTDQTYSGGQGGSAGYWDNNESGSTKFRTYGCETGSCKYEYYHPGTASSSNWATGFNSRSPYRKPAPGASNASCGAGGG
jgi:hypothetical protein